jgi:hypothetical protein
MPSLRTLSIHHNLDAYLDCSTCANLIALDRNSYLVRL